MNKIKEIIDTSLKWFLVFIISLMTINVLWQVFSRFVLNNPSSFTEELARYTLVWLGVLGAGYAVGQRLHLAIDLLSHKLHGKYKIYLEIIINISILFFASTVMLIGGFRLVSITLSLNQISASLQIPLGYVYLVIPISGLIIIFYVIYFILNAIKELKKL